MSGNVTVRNSSKNEGDTEETSIEKQFYILPTTLGNYNYETESWTQRKIRNKKFKTVKHRRSPERRIWSLQVVFFAEDGKEMYQEL